MRHGWETIGRGIPPLSTSQGTSDLKLILPAMCCAVSVVQRLVPEEEEENSVSKAGILKGTDRVK